MNTIQWVAIGVLFILLIVIVMEQYKERFYRRQESKWSRSPHRHLLAIKKLVETAQPSPGLKIYIGMALKEMRAHDAMEDPEFCNLVNDISTKFEDKYKYVSVI